jgi:hypothetical protein
VSLKSYTVGCDWGPKINKSGHRTPREVFHHTSESLQKVQIVKWHIFEAKSKSVTEGEILHNKDHFAQVKGIV